MEKEPDVQPPQAKRASTAMEKDLNVRSCHSENHTGLNEIEAAGAVVDLQCKSGKSGKRKIDLDVQPPRAKRARLNKSKATTTVGDLQSNAITAQVEPNVLCLRPKRAPQLRKDKATTEIFDLQRDSIATQVDPNIQLPLSTDTKSNNLTKASAPITKLKRKSTAVKVEPEDQQLRAKRARLSKTATSQNDVSNNSASVEQNKAINLLSEDSDDEYPITLLEKQAMIILMDTLEFSGAM